MSLLQIQPLGLVNPSNIWLIQNSQENLPANINLEINSQVFTFNQDFSLDEVYKVQEFDQNIKRNMIGEWSPEEGLKMTRVPIWERRKDLTGVKVVAATLKVNQIQSNLDNVQAISFYSISEHSLYICQWACHGQFVPVWNSSWYLEELAG